MRARVLVCVAAALVLAVSTALLQTPAGRATSKPPLPCKFKGDKRYPGDDAPKAELARWLGQGARKAKLPAELPVMAALVESGVANLPGGDSDSVGFFQMRVGIWNSGPYAGYPDHPELQLQWFVDMAALVRERAMAAGAPPSRFEDPAFYGEWIADAIRPPEELRGRYQLRLEDARSLLCG